MLHAPVGLILVDRQGCIVSLNVEATRMFLWTPEELAGTPIEVLVPAETRPAHEHWRSAFIAAPTRRRMGQRQRLQGVRKDGTLLFVEVGLGAFQADEGDFVLAAVVDVTGRHAAEEREAELTKELERRLGELQTAHDIVRTANVRLQQLVRAAAHDLKSPVRTVSLFAGVLRSTAESSLDDVGLRHLDRLEQAAARSMQLVDGLTELARTESRSRPFERVDLDRAAASVVASAQDVIDSSGAVVRVEPLPPVVGDAELIECVLHNLVTNALVFTEGLECVWVVVDAVVHGKEVTLRVTDRGPGVPVEERENVFLPMRRLHSAAEGAGAGLGLAVCREAVAKHGGRIWIEDDEGVGCRVCFTLTSAS